MSSRLPEDVREVVTPGGAKTSGRIDDDKLDASARADWRTARVIAASGVMVLAAGGFFAVVLIRDDGVGAAAAAVLGAAGVAVALLAMASHFHAAPVSPSAGGESRPPP